MDLLLLIDDDKSHFVYTKDFKRFMFQKTKNRYKKWFCKNSLQCFRSKNKVKNHKEDCLSINGVQSENYFKQIPVPFKIYVDFECNLKSARVYEVSYTKNIMTMFFVVLLSKLFVLMIDLVNRLLFIKAILLFIK